MTVMSSQMRRSSCLHIRCVVSIVFLFIALALPSRSTSQEVDETVMNLAQAAASMSDAGDYEGAATLYLRAYELSKAPLLLYNAARVRDKNGDLARARELYERYLREETDPRGMKRGRKRLSDLLDRIPGLLTLKVTPADATVEVGGREISGSGPHEMKRGTYSVVVTRKGYSTERQTVEIRAGKETSVEVSLKPLPGKLDIRCGVRGARVVVNGTFVGAAPLSRPLELEPGRYVVEVTAPDRERFVKTVNLSFGETARVDVRLVLVEEPPPPPPPASVRFPLSLAFSEGLLAEDQQRTHVGMEAEIGFRIAETPWLVPCLGLAWTVESPVNVTIRPGLRWYFGTFPIYVRTAAVAMVMPVRAWAFLAGLGGDVPLWEGGFLRMEVHVSVWSTSVIPVDFALGLGHAF